MALQAITRVLVKDEGQGRYPEAAVPRVAGSCPKLGESKKQIPPPLASRRRWETPLTPRDLGLWEPELGIHKLCCRQPPGLWLFVKTVLQSEYWALLGIASSLTRDVARS